MPSAVSAEAATDNTVATGGAAQQTAEHLRGVAESVRRFFPQPFSASEVVLIDVDPHRLHAFWNLALADIRAARGELGVAGTAAPLILRVTPVGEGAEGLGGSDVEVQGLQGQTYVDVWSAPRIWRATLGLQRPDGSLLELGSAAPVALPVGHAADEGSRAQAPAEPARKPIAEHPTIRPEALGVVELPEPKADPFPAPPGSPEGAVPGDVPVVAAGADPAVPTAISAAPAGPVDMRPARDSEPRPDPFPAPPGTPEGAVPIGTPADLPPLPGEAPAMEPGAGASAAPDHQAPLILPELPGGPVEMRPAWDVEPRPDPFPAPPGTPEGGVPPGTPTQLPALPEGTMAEAAGGGAYGEATEGAQGQGEHHGGEHGEAGQQPAGDGAAEQDLFSFDPQSSQSSQVMGLSSFVFGQPDVQLEVNAELHIFGRARPGSELHLFGSRVTLRPDGTFSIRRPLPKGALVVSALLSGGEGE